MRERFLIIADGYDSLPNARLSRPKASFDADLLRSWLTYLDITDYDVCWARDDKLKNWNGPVLALGDVAHAAAIKLGKRVYKLPHPTSHNWTAQDKDAMHALLVSVKKKIMTGPRQAKPKRIKVIR